MTDFATDIAAGLTEIREALGVPGTYTRASNGAAVVIDYVLPLRARNAADGDYPYLNSRQQDFSIARSSLVIADTEFEPQAGDRLAVTLNGTALVFQALPDDQGDVWDWQDHGGHTHRRIHFTRQN